MSVAASGSIFSPFDYFRKRNVNYNNFERNQSAAASGCLTVLEMTIHVSHISEFSAERMKSYFLPEIVLSLQWRHNGLDGVSNHQPHHCLLSRLFGRRSKKTSKLRVTGLCVGNSPGTGEFPAQMASSAENVSI